MFICKQYIKLELKMEFDRNVSVTYLHFNVLCPGIYLCVLTYICIYVCKMYVTSY